MVEPNPFVAAVQWLQSVLLGSMATTIAVVAVASVGLLLLSGWLSFRRGAQVVVGCFMMFGASALAQGIVSAMATEIAVGEMPVPRQSPPLLAAAPQAPISAPPFDPYAGATVSPR